MVTEVLKRIWLRHNALYHSYGTAVDQNTRHKEQTTRLTKYLDPYVMSIEERGAVRRSTARLVRIEFQRRSVAPFHLCYPGFLQVKFRYGLAIRNALKRSLKMTWASCCTTTASRFCRLSYAGGVRL